jgi:hypothetical protein
LAESFLSIGQPYTHKPGTIEAHGGGVIQYVTDWLDEEAKSKEWQKYVEVSRQGDLL